MAKVLSTGTQFDHICPRPRGKMPSTASWCTQYSSKTTFLALRVGPTLIFCPNLFWQVSRRTLSTLSALSVKFGPKGPYGGDAAFGVTSNREEFAAATAASARRSAGDGAKPATSEGIGATVQV